MNEFRYRRMGSAPKNTPKPSVGTERPVFWGRSERSPLHILQSPFLGGTDERTTWLRVEHLETVTHPVYQLVTVEEEACNLTIIIH